MLNVEEILMSLRCENVEGYVLVDNYGWTFTKRGMKYDMRHWQNLYGEPVDFWDVNDTSFDTLDEALLYIKSR